MERSDVDTRAVVAGAVSVAVLGSIAMLLADELLSLSVLLLLIAFLGGAISGYRTRSAHSAVLTGAAGALAGYLLAVPVGVLGVLASKEAIAGANVSDPGSLGMTIAVVYPAMLGLPAVLVIFAGYLGGSIAKAITGSSSRSENSHRYFD